MGQWNTKHGMRDDVVINLYFKAPYWLMEGTCDHCGSKNVQLQEKKIENQVKHVCNECAWMVIFFIYFFNFWIVVLEL